MISIKKSGRIEISLARVQMKNTPVRSRTFVEKRYTKLMFVVKNGAIISHHNLTRQGRVESVESLLDV